MTMGQMDEKENLRLFDQFRNEAIQVTGEAIRQTVELTEDADFAGLGDEVLEKLRYSQNILQSNTLPVSLLASFQKGKTSTTTAMADGHEITPSGKGGGGIRLSAVPVTLYNDATATEVKVHPYSKQALAEHIIECCGGHLESTNAMEYDLDKRESREILKKAVEDEIEDYKNESDYDLERLAMLRSAVLILHYYGSESHKALLSGKFRTIEDIQPFIAFPRDLESRWKDLRKEGFDIVRRRGEDGEPLFGEVQSLYVFVEDVVIPVHSEFMGETGTAVIDAPGTMASNEDTERALRAASSAAVVLFIMDGEQQLSEADKMMLRKLKNAGMAEKVVFVINFRKNPEIIKDAGGIEESILASIEEAGYCAPHQKKLLYYNAFLAVRAAQGRLLLRGEMDPLTEEAICEDARKRKIRFSTLEEAWKKSALRVLRAIDAEEAADELSELGLCMQTVESIERESRWKSMITSLREHVMKNRVSGVLKDLGVQPVANGIREMEAVLKRKETTAYSDEEAARAGYEQAKGLLNKFSEKVDTLIDDNFGSAIDKALAQNYFDDVLLGAVKSAAGEAAPEVFKMTGLKGNVVDILGKAGRKGKGALNAMSEFFGGEKIFEVKAPNGLREKCAAAINEKLKDAMTVRAHRWSGNLEKLPEYRGNIEAGVRRTQESLIDTWEKLGLAENRLLTNIAPVPADLSGLISKDAVNAEVRGMAMDTMAAVGYGEVSSVFKGMISAAGAYVGAAWLYVYILPVDLIIPGFAEIAFLLSAAVAAIVYKVSKGQREKKIAEMETAIASQLNSEIVRRKEEILENIIHGDPRRKPPVPGVSSIRLFYVGLFKQIVRKQERELEKAYEEALKELKATEEERKRIAKKAAEWRTGKIEPLCRRLDELLDRINDLWG